MGQTCSGCNCQNLDDNKTMDFSTNNNGNLDSGIRNMKINTDYEMLNRFSGDDVQNLIKIQSYVRGHQTRTKFKNGQLVNQSLTVSLDDLAFTENLEAQNGTIYNGQVLKDGYTKHGFGVQAWPDGARYEGYWMNDKAYGRGKFNHVDGDTYDGMWQNDKANGFGIYNHLNGSVYAGQWTNDKQHGYGEEVWEDNSEYKGMYYDSKKHGKGMYKWSDGNQYIGDWNINQIDGNGIFLWNDGRVYIGSWSQNMMQGEGVYLWADGRIYQGAYSNDKKSGYGVYIWADGKAYLGNWKEGQQEGEGCYILPNGEVKKGFWANKKRQNWLQINNQECEKLKNELEAIQKKKYIFQQQIEEQKRYVENLHTQHKECLIRHQESSPGDNYILQVKQKTSSLENKIGDNKANS